LKLVASFPAAALEPPHEDPRDDQQLIAALNDGDQGAFETLYRRHRDWAVSVAFGVTRDHALALDVLQESFLYLARKFPGFTLTCQFRSFLYPAVRNLAIAARRKAERTQSDGAELPELEAPPVMATSSEGRAGLAGVLAQLPEPQREVLLLRFVDGFSLEEIAGALHVPPGTVKSRLHHALAALRRDPLTKKFFET
jgi:RNA polymerase sigma-70 factor (ECF subfamily)